LINNLCPSAALLKSMLYIFLICLTKNVIFLNNEISLTKKGNNGCLPITQVVIQQKKFVWRGLHFVCWHNTKLHVGGNWKKLIEIEIFNYFELHGNPISCFDSICCCLPLAMGKMIRKPNSNFKLI